MKWFKHQTDASESGEFISELESIFGLEGYARWFKLLEKVGYRMDKTDLCSAAYPWSDWQRFLRGKRKKLETFLEHCQNKGKISYSSTGNILEIKIPNLLIIRDNHSKNLQAADKRLASKEVELEVDKEVELEVKDLTAPAKQDAAVASESEVVERYRKAPDKSWNGFLLAWYDSYGRLPAWSKGRGSKQEYIHLADYQKKLNGDKPLLLNCFKLFLKDEDRYLVDNAHRPSCMGKRLDRYLNQIKGIQKKKDYGFDGRADGR